MVQCIRDSSFVQNVVKSLRAKNGYLDIRERIDQPPISLTFQLLKVQPKCSMF